MIKCCPICDGDRHEDIWALEQSPLLELVGAQACIQPRWFAPLHIVRCLQCRHLFNKAYDVSSWSLTYRHNALTNRPVHSTMLNYLDSVVSWVGVDAVAGRRVVEVGAGTGVLSRKLAHHAQSVLVVEPNPRLTIEDLPEENIELLNEPFRAALVKIPADVVICRQVLEHVADPLDLLEEMNRSLVPEGLLYLEVPSAEYIEQQGAFFDLHNEHVQYFHRGNLLRLVARAGFALVREQQIKNGHDLGLLLKKGPPLRDSCPPAQSTADLAQRLTDARAAWNRRLGAMEGDFILYGATSQGSAFLNALLHPERVAAVLDDNAEHQGLALFTPGHLVPVEGIEWLTLKTASAVIISAYLHQRVIAERLTAAGFKGEILPLVTH